MRLRCWILLGAGVITTLPTEARAQVVATPYIDSYVAGDAETGRTGIGASVGYYFWRRLGFELDVELHPHFFKDEEVAWLVPDEGVDLDTDATLFMANAVVPFRVQGAAGIWCPYGTVGLGVIRAVFDGFVFDADADQEEYDSDQTNLGFDVGGGVMHALTDRVGLRVDARYVRALVDEHAGRGGYLQDYDMWRVSVGATFGFPRGSGSR